MLIFSLIINLYFLIAQTFNPLAELVIPIGIPSKEGKAEIEIHPVIEKAKIRKCLIQCRVVQTFLCFSLFLPGNNFLFALFF